ncbi:phosphocholine cytidylyltransferase family protein [Novosphingobium album (ex Liu et al. 2023)]|uniref:Phosphocholine cytidylyltransferase family protein n=1 Tax=Novosphingobium album (ex Liu et al. 2023) TaxID=3031130 RepID=A0ABT5WV19_9SPHN|nr:phosphocholine cytidylyltransferase family protein [Novosphingobium album (ex Liu et al. 2023)]MDE8653748.1 phosphocholine cytidylyltransferase family protein [Novosphingobium album (ex Liu et al. 2023)]
MIEHAILLSAGQGSRMLPLTAERPKCLIDFSGRTLLEWQVEMLARGGVKRIDVVTGFMTDMVDACIARIADPRVTITTRFNPFYKVADNLGSCWIAREAMRGDFLILNGDTLVSEELVRRVQQGGDAPGGGWPIAVTIDAKPSYDSDDMKVERARDGRLVHIGKTLTAAQSNAESIGFLAFRGEGADLFREAVRKAMRTPEGVQHWYLKVIDSLAATGKVGTVSIEGLDWAEVDFLNDIEIATQLTDRWAAAGKG